VRDGPVLSRSADRTAHFRFRRWLPNAAKSKIDSGRRACANAFEEARRIAEEDPLRALTLYSELVGREPGNFDAHMRLAVLLERENDLDGRDASSARRRSDRACQRRSPFQARPALSKTE